MVVTKERREVGQPSAALSSGFPDRELVGKEVVGEERTEEERKEKRVLGSASNSCNSVQVWEPREIGRCESGLWTAGWPCKCNAAASHLPNSLGSPAASSIQVSRGPLRASGALAAKYTTAGARAAWCLMNLHPVGLVGTTWALNSNATQPVDAMYILTYPTYVGT